MRERYIILSGILFILLALFSYKATFALFTDSALATGNSFSVASIFPSNSPTITTSPSETPTLTITPTTTPTATPTPPENIANHLVISEVQINGGPSNADNDFIELYNPTNAGIDLNGHRLVKRTGSNDDDDPIKSWTDSTIVPAHGYYLWANSSIASSIGADTSTTATISVSNSIALRNGPGNTGTVVDQLSWNSASQSLKEGTEFSPDPGANQSIERKANSTSTATSMTTSDSGKGNGFDTNNNANDFVLRTVSQPQNSSSPTETP